MVLYGAFRIDLVDSKGYVLERELAALRARRASLDEAEYLDLIEPILLELGTIAATAAGEPTSEQTPKATP